MQNRYKALLTNQLSTEQFSRQALGLLEAELREVTLLSLQEWLKLDIVSPDLFNAVANLRFPSWGSWNGLIITLRKVRNKALQQADAATREKIEKSPLTDLLNRLFSNIKNENNALLLKAFYQQSKQSLPRKPSLQSLLSTPIGLRNRISHDNPTDEQFWNDLSQSLRPVIEWLAEENSNNHQQLDRSPPWFIQQDKQWFTYNGISAKGDAINYVSDTGTPLESSEHIHDVLLTLQKIMGKKDLQETDFRKLLSKLAPEESKGVLVGDYLVGKFIAEGAHGAVHKGIQLSTGRSVAIKFLKEGLSPDIALRFKQEAEFLSHLNHPHIVDVIGYVENQAWSPPRARDYSLSDEKWYQDFSKGNDKGGIKTFIAMEWITGQTLDDYFIEKQAQASTGSAHRNTADFPKLTQWFIDITTALEHVHQSDIIHRDVKPSNLMVNEQGTIKLMDFGIARSYEGLDARLTTDLNARLGSPAYMSPEQIKANEANDRVGPASDVYGLMAVFYELYTQKRLYNHDDENVTVDTITELKTDKDKKERPTAPVEHNKKIPPEINTILSIGLEHEIADRYPDMETLRTDLVHVMRDEPIEYKKPTMLRRAQLGYRRNRGVINVVLMSLLIISSVFGWDYYRVTIERDKAEIARVEAVEAEKVAEEERNRAVVAEKVSAKERDKAEVARAEAEKSAEAEKEAKELAKKQRDRALSAENAKQQQVLETNYQLAKSFEQKSMRALEKGNSQEKGEVKILENYRKAFLYALEAKKLELPKNKVALKDVSLGKLTNIYEHAIDSTLFEFPLVSSLPWVINKITLSSDRKYIATFSEETGNIIIWNSDDGGKLVKIFKIGDVNHFDFSPDHRKLIISQDSGISIWNTQKGTLEYNLEGDINKTHSAIYSPDGSLIASISNNNVDLWDSSTGTLMQVLRGHKEAVMDMVFSPDGARVTSVSKDKTIRSWDISTGTLKQTLKGHTDTINAVIYSPDGKIIASASDDKSIRIWGAKTGKLKQLLKNSNPILNLKFRKDGKELASISSEGIALWDIQNSKLKQRLFDYSSSGFFAFSYDSSGDFIIALPVPYGEGNYTSSQALELWDTNLHKFLSNHVPNLIGSNSDNTLVAMHCDTGICILDTKSKKIKEITKEVFIDQNRIAIFSFDNKKMIYASLPPNSNYYLDNVFISVFNLSKGEVTTIKNLDGDIFSTTFHDDEPLLAIAKNNSIKVINIETKKIIMLTKNFNNGIHSLKFSSNGEILAINFINNYSELWSTKSHNILYKLGKTGEVSFSSDGKYFSTTINNTSSLWDLENGRKKFTYKAPELLDDEKLQPDKLREIWEVSKNSKFNKNYIFYENKTLAKHIYRSIPTKSVITIDSNESLNIVDGNYNQLNRTLTTSSKTGMDIYFKDSTYDVDYEYMEYPIVSFNKNGKYFLTISNDKVKLINIKTGKAKKTFKDCNKGLKTILFSPNNKTIAALSSNYLCIWDIKTNKIQTRIKIKSNLLSYNSDSTLLAFDDGENINILNISTNKIIKIIKVGNINKVLFSPKENILLSSSIGKIEFWDIKTGLINKKIKLDGYGWVKTLSFNPDGTTLAFSTGDSIVFLDVLSNEKKIKNLPRRVTTLAYNFDGSLLAYSLEDGKKINVIDSKTLKLKYALIDDDERLTREGYNLYIYQIAFNPVNNVLLSASTDHNLRVWDPYSPFMVFLNKFDPEKVSNALQFLWEMTLNKEEFNFIYKPRTPSLYPNKKGYYYSEDKFNDLLDMPHEDESKMDQLVRWLESRCAYKDENRKKTCESNLKTVH